MTVTDEQRARFDEHGYLVFDPGFPEDLLESAVAELDRLWDRSASKPDDPFAPRIRHAWRQSPAMRELTTWPAIDALLCGLFGRQPVAFQTLSFYVGTEQHLHSDAIHFNSFPTGLMCGVWIALEDMDEDNGALLYAPGSHRWPEYRMEDVGVPSVRIYYHEYEKFIVAKLDETGLATESACIGKGQALVWHGNLLHGGGPRRDRRRTRLSHVVHYTFDGCGMWAPIRSRGRRRFVRNPRPIRAAETAADRLRWLRGFVRPWCLWHALTHNVPHLAKTILLRQN